MTAQARFPASPRPDLSGARGEAATRSERLRVAHLISHTALNGVGTSVKGLIDAQIAAGCDVMLVHPSRSWIGDQAFEGAVTRLATTYGMSPRELARVGHAIRNWGRGVLHAHGSGANKYAMVFRLAAGAPTVMTAHARKFQLPWMFAHGVIGLSAPTIAYYADRRLVSRKRIFDIPNLFRMDEIAPVTEVGREEARGALGLPSEGFVIGSVGKIDERKRQADMIGVLARLVRAGHDARLVLIGRPPSDPRIRSALAAAATDPATAGRVHLPGQRADAVALMASFNVFICASAVEEAPISPIEAMAQAIPVVSTRVGNMPDLLPADRLLSVGDIQGIADAVALLLGDARLAEAAGMRDRRTIAATLSPAVILPRIEAVYRTAIAHARDGRRKPVRAAGEDAEAVDP